MKRIKNAYYLLLVAAMLSASAAYCVEYKVYTTGDNTAPGYNGYGPWQTGVGGEFSFNTINWDPTGSYAGATKNQSGVPMPSFQSFCVEGREFIYANTYYDVTFTSASEWTGVSLTKGAAWLYSQFVQGALSGYDYANMGVGRHTSADLLQRAIWAFMDGQEGEVLNLSNPFESLAADQFGGGLAGLAAADTVAGANNYGVKVMNLWAVGAAPDYNVIPGQNATGYQDMLVYVPDGGMTVVLLGMALSGLAALSRRLRV